MLRSIEVGNRPGDLENARVTAGGEAEAFGDEFEEAVAGFIRLAMLEDEARRHLGVAVDAAVVEAIFLASLLNSSEMQVNPSLHSFFETSSTIFFLTSSSFPYMTSRGR